MNQSNAYIKSAPLNQRIKELLHNEMFVYSMLSLTTLFFVVNGI